MSALLQLAKDALHDEETLLPLWRKVARPQSCPKVVAHRDVAELVPVGRLVLVTGHVLAGEDREVWAAGLVLEPYRPRQGVRFRVVWVAPDKLEAAAQGGCVPGADGTLPVDYLAISVPSRRAALMAEVEALAAVPPVQ